MTPPVRHSSRCLGITLILAVTLPGSARAFSSVGQGAHHSAITAEAATAKGFPDSTARLLGQFAEKPDRDENGFDVLAWKPVVNKKLYEARHHFDRNVGVSDTTAFVGGVAYMLGQKQEAIDQIQPGMN